MSQHLQNTVAAPEGLFILLLFKGTIFCSCSYSIVSLFSNFIPFTSFGFVFVFLGPQPWHMEVPRLGVESELKLLAYTIGNTGSLTY